MKINRRERLALGVFSTALVALAVDKLLIPATEPASAQAVEPPARVAPGPDAAALLRSQSAPAASLNDLPDLCDWSRLGLPTASAVTTETPAESDGVFSTAHKLDGVVLGPRPAAIIGGRILRIGDVLDGFRLETVEEDRITFIADERRIVLSLQRPKMRR